MKRLRLLFAILVTLIVMAFASSTSSTVKGDVVYDGRSDYHIVFTGQYYVIVEWYSGPDFSKGDALTGDLHSYGFKMVTVNKSEKQTKIYIENYWSNIDKCYDWLKKNNKIK